MLGGRVLDATVYEKGVRSGTAEWFWDRTSWVLRLDTEHPNAITQVWTVYNLSIEPTTIRYAKSGTVTIKVGSGDTAANSTDRYGPWAAFVRRFRTPSNSGQ